VKVVLAGLMASCASGLPGRASTQATKPSRRRTRKRQNVMRGRSKAAFDDGSAVDAADNMTARFDGVEAEGAKRLCVNCLCWADLASSVRVTPLRCRRAPARVLNKTGRPKWLNNAHPQVHNLQDTLTFASR
jgi:hypothetical protein